MIRAPALVFRIRVNQIHQKCKVKLTNVEGFRIKMPTLSTLSPDLKNSSK